MSHETRGARSEAATTSSASPCSTFQPTAQGGRFEVNGNDQTGTALSISIERARFGSISAVGG